MPSGFGGIISELISPTKYAEIPAAQYVSPQVAQMQSIAGNTQALSSLENMGRAIDAYNIAQKRSAVTGAIPNFNALTGQQSQNLLNWSRGIIPSDVAGQTQLRSAGRALAGGYGGSGMGANLTARDLGLTSLQLQQAAGSQMPGYLNEMYNLLMPSQGLYNVQGGMITPQQQIAQMNVNEANRFAQQSMVNERAALPNPLMQKVGDFAGDIGNIALTAAGGYFGGLAGGGMGSMLGSNIGGAMGGGSGQANAMGDIFSNYFNSRRQSMPVGYDDFGGGSSLPFVG